MTGCGNEDDNKPVEEEQVVVEPTEDAAEMENTEQQEESVEEQVVVEKAEAEMDMVYGKLDIENYKRESDLLYRDEERNVLYLLAGDEIFQAEVNLDAALGINLEMDQSFLTGHAFDYMAEDASLVQTKSENEFVYESKILGKKYDVLFVSDTGDNVITRIIVSQHIE